MQQTLNLTTTTTTTPTPTTTTTTTRNPLTPFSNPNIPSKSTPFPTFSLHKPPIFPTLSSKTITTPLPPKPIKIPILRSIPPPPPSNPQPLPVIATPNPNPNPNPNFQEKALFLDSIGIDSLSLLSNHHSAAAIAAASLTDLKPLFEYLSSFDFSRHDLRRIVSMCPEIISLRLRDISAVFSFLLREAAVPAADLRRVIHRRPRLLASSVETRLRPTMYFLQSIGIHERSG